MKKRRCVSTRLRVEELEGRLVPSFSTNWSGYAVVPSNFTVSYVQASWTVPAVTGKGWLAVWPGIDGYSSNTVEQIGTLSVANGGTSQYFAWYEMYPSQPSLVPIQQLTIHPGDLITASVTAKSRTSFLLSITDKNTQQTFPTTQTLSSPAALSSAEWIVERPGHGQNALLDLPPLAPPATGVTFTNVGYDTGGGTTADPIPSSSSSTSTTDPITMVSVAGSNVTILATPSGLSARGTSFTVTDDVPPPSGHQSGNGGPVGLFAPNVPTVSALSDPSLVQASITASRSVMIPLASAVTTPAAVAVSQTVVSTSPAPIVSSQPASSSSRSDNGGGGGAVISDNAAVSNTTEKPMDKPVPAQQPQPATPAATPAAPAAPLPAPGPDASSEEAIDAVFQGNREGTSLLFELPDLDQTANQAPALAGLLFALGLSESAQPEVSERRKRKLPR